MTKPRRFTGWHMTAIMVAFFGVVIGVNLIMASYATSTFGGTVVDNSYVASQKFNTWLDKAERQKALGWSAKASRLTDGRVAVDVAGLPDGEVAVAAMARHPLGRMPDADLTFVREATGRFVSAQPLAAGRWTLRLEVKAGQDSWRGEQDI